MKKRRYLRRVVWLTKQWPANEWHWVPATMPNSHSFLHNDAKSDILMGNYGSYPFHTVKCCYILAWVSTQMKSITWLGDDLSCARLPSGFEARTTKKRVWHLTEGFNADNGPRIMFLRGFGARDSLRTYGFYCFLISVQTKRVAWLC